MKFNITKLVGLSEKEAIEQVIKKAGFKHRVMHRDGQSFMGTCDYCMDRVNLAINDGKVTSANLG